MKYFLDVFKWIDTAPIIDLVGTLLLVAIMAVLAYRVFSAGEAARKNRRVN